MTENFPVIHSPSLKILSRAIQAGDAGALSRFWMEMETAGSPLIEADGDNYAWVTFLWRDDKKANTVAVIQDWGCDGIREHHMDRLPNSDLWYYTRRLPLDTRTTYQLSPSSSMDPSESAPYLLDPLNHKIYTVYQSEEGNDIRFSLLELPDAPELPWRQRNVIEPAGAVQLHKPFADQRRLWTYLPPMRTNDPLPLLVVLDGRLYKELLHLPEMLDYLINQGKIPPVAAVLIDNPNRSELLCQPEFSKYMIDQVLPWVRASCPVTNEPRLNIVIGSSYGGLAAAFLAFQNPEVWGTVLSQTGWFRWQPEEDPEHHWLTRQFGRAPSLPVRFWLQVGKLEVAQMLDGGPSQLEANQYFRDVLRDKNYPVSYYEYSGGHDMSSLEFPLAKALQEVFQ